MIKSSNLPFKIPNFLQTLCSIFIFIALVCFTSGLLIDAKRTWYAFLISQLFVLYISLGAVFFIAVQHVSRAGWSVNIRRLMEACSPYIIWALPFALVLLFSGDDLYPWFNKDIVAKDHLLQHKSAYLNWTFFLIRILGFFAIWIFFSSKLVKLSLKQDKTGDPELSNKSIPYSVAFLILFALSFSFFSFDTLMSLEPHWFSTIFAVYSFAGSFQSFIAVLILLIIYLRRTGVVQKQLMNENHLHDLGKFLLGLTIFWAYIAFSQYMLVWYANLPEEAVYYLHRAGGDWKWLSIALIVFKFIVPFLFLLPRWVKRDEGSLIIVSVLILVMQYADLYWMAYPQLNPEHIVFGWIEIGLLLGFISLFVLSVFHFLSKHPLVPLQDPRQQESTSHEVTY